MEKTSKKVIGVSKISSSFKRIVSTAIVASLLMGATIGLTGCSLSEEIDKIPGYDLEYIEKSDHIYKASTGEYFYKSSYADYPILIEDSIPTGADKRHSYLYTIGVLDEFDNLKEILTSYGIQDAVNEYEVARKESNKELLNTSYSKVALLTLKGIIVAHIDDEFGKEIESIKIYSSSNNYEECVATITYKPRKEIVSGGIEVESKPEERKIVITSLGNYFESIIKAQDCEYSIEEIDELYATVINMLLSKVVEITDSEVELTLDEMKSLELRYANY